MGTHTIIDVFAGIGGCTNTPNAGSIIDLHGHSIGNHVESKSISEHKDDILVKDILPPPPHGLVKTT